MDAAMQFCYAVTCQGSDKWDGSGQPKSADVCSSKPLGARQATVTGGGTPSPGVCGADGKCKCNAGFEPNPHSTEVGGANNCGWLTCPGKTANGEECSGNSHGTCDRGTGKCECKAYPTPKQPSLPPIRYQGPTCANLACPNSCSGHGTCDTNTGTCKCDAGWKGKGFPEDVPFADQTERSDCSVAADCRTWSSGCNGHGKCNKDTGQCDCDPLWSKPTPKHDCSSSWPKPSDEACDCFHHTSNSPDDQCRPRGTRNPGWGVQCHATNYLFFYHCSGHCVPL